MATSQSSRTLPVAPSAVWAVVGDPSTLPRWWPGVHAVRDVSPTFFTQVLEVRWGEPVQATFRVVASDPPWRRAWSHEVAGTEFERVLEESVFEIALEPVGTGTAITLAHRETLRGYSRTSKLLLRRARARRLEEALNGLAALLAGADAGLS